MGLIYVDACLLIYAVENHPTFGAAIKEALSENPSLHYAISPLTKLECLTVPIRTANFMVQTRFEKSFERFSELPISAAVFTRATHLRAQFGLKTPDAIHLACAQHYNCAALWTNDERLAKAGYGLARNVLQ
jgi:uncharacterized protein